MRLPFAFVLFAAQVEGDLGFEAAVVGLVGFVALQAQAFEEVGVAADNRHLPVSGEGFVGRAEGVVGADEFAQGAEAFAVGRVGDDEAARAVAGLGGEASKLAPLQVQAVAEVKAGGVVACGSECRAVVVVAPDFQVEARESGFAPCDGFFVEALPDGRFVALPTGEAEARTFERGGDVGGHQQRFEQQGTAAAEGVDEVVAVGGELRPAGAVEECRREVFFDGRGAVCEAVAALVQAAAGKVEGEGEAAFAQVGVDADVGVFRVHVRAAVQGVAQLVGDGVFDFERAELGVADALADAVEVDGEGAVGVDVFVPRYRTGKGVDVVGVCDFAFGDNPEDAARHARPQAETVGDLKIARAGDDGDAEARVLQAEAFRFGE